MKLSVDKKADALYLRLDASPIVESEEVSPGVMLDYNESNQVVGVEMLHLSTRSSSLNLSALAIRVDIAVGADRLDPTSLPNYLERKEERQPCSSKSPQNGR